MSWRYNFSSVVSVAGSAIPFMQPSKNFHYDMHLVFSCCPIWLLLRCKEWLFPIWLTEIVPCDCSFRIQASCLFHLCLPLKPAFCYGEMPCAEEFKLLNQGFSLGCSSKFYCEILKWPLYVISMIPKVGMADHSTSFDFNMSLDHIR